MVSYHRQDRQCGNSAFICDFSRLVSGYEEQQDQFPVREPFVVARGPGYTFMSEVPVPEMRLSACLNLKGNREWPHSLPRDPWNLIGLRRTETFIILF